MRLLFKPGLLQSFLSLCLIYCNRYWVVIVKYDIHTGKTVILKNYYLESGKIMNFIRLIAYDGIPYLATCTE